MSTESVTRNGVTASIPAPTETRKGLYRLAIGLFMAILTLHGTYFRTPDGDSEPPVDWLVIARLVVCILGFAIGLMLVPKGVKWGIGTKLMTLYIAASGLSAFTSPYPMVVLGYFVLLAGACVLVLGLVYGSRSVGRLEAIERTWLITVSILILKDALTSILFPEMQGDDDIVRLGMGVTHATTISLYAGLVFWLSFTPTTAHRSA